MVSKCANPECDQAFRYFRAGKLFFIDRCKGAPATRLKSEYFWLCGVCSQSYQLSVTDQGKIELVAKPQLSEARGTASSAILCDDKRLHEALRFELRFLEQKGYEASAYWSFAEPSYLEDSPLCPNKHGSSTLTPCRDCVLAKLIPKEHLGASRACHFIPLDESGTTLFALHQAGASSADIQARLTTWIKRQIAAAV